MQPPHLPVMARETVELLAPAGKSLFLDGTVGAGGHAALILAAAGEAARLVGLDRDPAAIALAGQSLARFGDRVELIQTAFDRLEQVARPASLDGILLDLGVSSMQLDEAHRGFAFKQDGPLDMRMDNQGITAAQLLAQYDYRQIRDILKRLGEEPFADRIARAIEKAKEQEEITTTGRLAAVVENALPAAERKKRKIHPATKTFQGIRLAVNDELGRLERFLDQVPHALKPGGRLVIISYHSLEDRLVKKALARWARPCTCPPDLPVCACGKKPLFTPLTKGALAPSAREVATNPRSRSAKLRAGERTEEAA